VGLSRDDGNIPILFQKLAEYHLCRYPNVFGRIREVFSREEGQISGNSGITHLQKPIQELGQIGNEFQLGHGIQYRDPRYQETPRERADTYILSASSGMKPFRENAFRASLMSAPLAMSSGWGTTIPGLSPRSSRAFSDVSWN
jgi:hypothetical protein